MSLLSEGQRGMHDSGFGHFGLSDTQRGTPSSPESSGTGWQAEFPLHGRSQHRPVDVRIGRHRGLLVQRIRGWQRPFDAETGIVDNVWTGHWEFSQVRAFTVLSME